MRLDRTRELNHENLTVEEVSEYLRCSTETVRRYHRTKKLVGFRGTGNRLLFKREDVLDYERTCRDVAA